MTNLVGCTLVVEEDNMREASAKHGPICWSKSGKMRAGGTQKLTMQTKDLIPGPHTIQFTVLADGNTPPNPEAKISWKVAGQNVERRISIFDGASISGVCEGATIFLEDNSEAITGFDYTVTATIAPGTRAANAAPPVLYPIQATGYPGRFVVASGIPRVIPIDENAGITTVNITASALAAPAVLTEANVAAQLRDNPAATVLKQWDPRLTGWVPLCPGADELVLVNNFGANVIFGVVFGIDG